MERCNSFNISPLPEEVVVPNILVDCSQESLVNDLKGTNIVETLYDRLFVQERISSIYSKKAPEFLAAKCIDTIFVRNKKDSPVFQFDDLVPRNIELSVVCTFSRSIYYRKLNGSLSIDGKLEVKMASSSKWKFAFYDSNPLYAKYKPICMDAQENLLKPSLQQVSEQLQASSIMETRSQAESEFDLIIRPSSDDNCSLTTVENTILMSQPQGQNVLSMQQIIETLKLEIDIPYLFRRLQTTAATTKDVIKITAEIKIFMEFVCLTYEETREYLQLLHIKVSRKLTRSLKSWEKILRSLHVYECKDNDFHQMEDNEYRASWRFIHLVIFDLYKGGWTYVDSFAKRNKIRREMRTVNLHYITDYALSCRGCSWREFFQNFYSHFLMLEDDEEVLSTIVTKMRPFLEKILSL